MGRPPPASVRDFIDDNRQKIDRDDSVWPPDDVRNYAYEGGGSSAGSLSSINSGVPTGVSRNRLHRAGSGGSDSMVYVWHLA